MDVDPSFYYSIDFWYHIFRENTVRTRFITVDDSFVEYMLSGSFKRTLLWIDSIILPKADHYTREDPRLGGNFSDDSDDELDAGGEEIEVNDQNDNYV